MEFYSTPQFFADQADSMVNRAANGASRQQTISITDVISEGPIQGLVGNGAGVYLNDDSIFPEANAGISTAIDNVQVTLTNGASTITINPALPSEEVGNGYRLLAVRAVDTTTVQTIGNVATDDTGRHSVPLTIASAFFDDEMIGATVETARLKIDALDLVVPGFISARSSATQATFVPTTADTATLDNFKSQQTNNTVKLEIDYLIQVNTGVVVPYLVGNWLHTSGTYDADLSQPFFLNTSGADLYNYDPNTGKFPKANVQFRPGTINQTPISSMYGTAGGTSIGNGNFTPLPLEFIDADSDTTGSAASPAEIQASASQGFGLTDEQIAEVDAVRLSFAYTSMFSTSKKDGAIHPAGAKYKIEIIRIINGVSQTAQTIAHRVHGGEFQSQIAFQEVITLEEYRPFTDFKIKVTRETRHDGRQINSDGSEGKTITECKLAVVLQV